MLISINWLNFFDKHISSIIAGLGVFLIIISVILNFLQNSSSKNNKIYLLVTFIVGFILLTVGVATNKKWAEILSYLGVIVTVFGFINLITSIFNLQKTKRKIILNSIILAFGVVILGVGILNFNDYQLVVKAFVILIIISCLISFIIIVDERKNISKLKTKNITIVGVLGALGVISMLIGIPIMPVAGFDFLKLDFCLVVVVCTLLLFDFKTAVAVAFISNLVDGLLKPGVIFLLDQGVNFIASTLFLIPFYFLVEYSKKRIDSETPHKVSVTIFYCVIATISTTVLMILINYFVIIPIYDAAIFDGGLVAMLLLINGNKFIATLIIFGTFNIMKWTAVSLVISLIYSRFLKFKMSIYYEESLNEELKKSIL